MQKKILRSPLLKVSTTTIKVVEEMKKTINTNHRTRKKRSQEVLQSGSQPLTKRSLNEPKIPTKNIPRTRKKGLKKSFAQSPNHYHQGR